MSEKTVPLTSLIARISPDAFKDAPQRRVISAIKLALDQKVTPETFRNLIELGTISTQNSTNVNISGGAISGVQLLNSYISGSPIEFAFVDTAITSNYTINPVNGNYFFLSSDNIYNVNLPSGSAGYWFHIQNTGGYDLTVIGTGVNRLLMPGEFVVYLYTNQWREIG